MLQLRSRWAAAVVLAASALAQEAPAPDAPAPSGTPQPAVQEPGAEPQAAGAGVANPVFARVRDASVELRCFPTDISPRYEEKLTEGSVVRTGMERDGFREVVLPLGVAGYVHKTYTSPMTDGLVSSTASKLAFRYRPQSQEAPVRFVDKDVSFLVVGEAGEWWRVRLADATAWVPSTSVDVFAADADVPTLEAAWSELERQHEEAAAKYVEGIAAAKLAAEVRTAREQRLDDLRQRFRSEFQKDSKQQAYAQLATDVAAFVAEVQDDETLRRSAEILQRDVELQKTVVEAAELIREKPVPAAMPDLGPGRTPDPLSRFDAVGWLRYDRSLTGKETVVLEKGGQILHYLTCKGGRYELGLFDGLEVGLIGPKERPDSQSIRHLDVARLEVLSRAPRR
jgi:hypothetical protein